MRKALYRKYRPCCLADVIGEEQVTTPLGQALKTGKFSHAYLFTGPRGCGKTSVARIFAHEVNQFKYELEDEYIDIIEIDAASNTGVDNIRELREKACVVPSIGKYKIYIIDEVHMLSKSAFNALLKTLEEPPAHVIFIMATTDPEKVPITILSRAQVFQFRLVSPEIMEPYLAEIAKKEKISCDAAAIKLIARRGAGSFRDSLSLLDQISTLSSGEITAADVESALGLPKDDNIKQLLSAYRAQDLAAASAALKSYYSTGGKASVLAEELISAILATPDPAFYHLLTELVAVKDPFAEAKLLLCFMPSAPSIPASSAVVTKPTLSATNGPAIAKPAPNVSDSIARLRPSSDEDARDDGPSEECAGGNAQAQASAQCPDGNPPCGRLDATAPTATFDWATYLSSVDQSSPRLRVLLNQSSYSFDGKTLTIIPGNKQAAKVFARAADAEILRKHLAPGHSLVIAEQGAPALRPATKDPTISQISDIMGNIQEVNIQNGGDPF